MSLEFKQGIPVTIEKLSSESTKNIYIYVWIFSSISIHIFFLLLCLFFIIAVVVFLPSTSFLFIRETSKQRSDSHVIQLTTQLILTPNSSLPFDTIHSPPKLLLQSHRLDLRSQFLLILMEIGHPSPEAALKNLHQILYGSS